MVEQPIENIFLRRSKGLIHALIISLSLNIGLIATFSYFVLKEKTHRLQGGEEVKSYKPLSRTNAEVAREYFSYSFADLVKELENKELVEEGCRYCDLSLGNLVTFHHLDLDRALSGIFIQKRHFTFHHADKGWISLTLFPGLDEDGMKAIEIFLREEIWPFTAQGLFLEMKKSSLEIPPSLQETFFLTEHFHLIDLAFKQFPYLFPKEVLLELMLDGEWEIP